MNFANPKTEATRLQALADYRILDSESEQAFDDLAALAADICNAPIALVTFVDSHRQWFKAKIGLAISETPRDQAFCAHTILQTEVLVVEDATLDDRFSRNPLVTSDPKIRFYAGAPLLTRDGFGLGSLCVIDRKPRQLSPAQLKSLKTLGRVAVAHLEFRRTSAQLAAVAEELQEAKQLLPICSYCKGIRNDAGYWEKVENYIKARTNVLFSHGMCPRCAHEQFPEIFPDVPTGSPKSTPS